MRIHLIAIGGKVMHNLALELQARGHQVSGSDDEIYDPARSRLDATDLLPQSMGWDASRITADIDLIILGMHAHADNPELVRAQALGINIQSFPEFAGEAYDDKLKIVAAGSHGKSTITAMIMHVFKVLDYKSDYLLGGILDGFDRMVSISDAQSVVIEGDEYLSSRIDASPKMMHYHGDVIILTGIEWDHKNVFPKFQIYKQQFANLIDQAHQEKSHIIWYKEDVHLQDLMKDYPVSLSTPYEAFEMKSGNLIHDGEGYEIKVFGKHNLANMKAAMHACGKVGIEPTAFCNAISSFRGVGKRLERINDDPIVYLDYAHAPSKVRATVKAVTQHHANASVLAVYELHTYSSLSKDFLPNYKGAITGTDDAIVFFDPHAIKMKRLPDLDKKDVGEAFGMEGLKVIDNPSELKEHLNKIVGDYDVILLMSSGTFGGLDIQDLLT